MVVGSKGANDSVQSSSLSGTNANASDGDDSYFIDATTVAGHGGDGGHASAKYRSAGNISNPGAGEGTYIGEGGFLGNDGNASPVGYDVYGFDYGTNKNPGASGQDGAVPHHLGNKVEHSHQQM